VDRALADAPPLHAEPSVALPRLGLALAVITMAAAAFATRFWHLGRRSIWLDEAWGWRTTTLSLRGAVDWAADSKDPPLYYFVLRAVTDVFGDGEGALRAPSAIAGALTVLLVAFVAWRAAGPVAAAVAGVLLLANASALVFAQEARMYPLLGLLALAASAALARLLARPTPSRAVLYAALASALVYTHYAGLVVLGVHAALIALYGGMRWRDSGDRGALLAGYGALVTTAIIYAPWAPNLWRHSTAGAFYIPPPDRGLVADVVRAQSGMGDDLLVVAFVVVLAPFAALAVARRWREPLVGCVAALALVPVALGVYSYAVTPVLDVRQASPYIPATAFLAGLAVAEVVRRLRSAGDLARSAAIALGAAAVALAAISAGRAMRDAYDAGPIEDWRAAATEARATGGPVWVWRRYASTPLRYELGDGDIREVPPAVFNGAPLDAPPGQPAVLLLSHETPEERATLLRVFAGAYNVGLPRPLPGITVVPMAPR
jgi:uncharacterized membrane protein